MLLEDIYCDIEVVIDMWGRLWVRLIGVIVEYLVDVMIYVLLIYEGDIVVVVVILEVL